MATGPKKPSEKLIRENERLRNQLAECQRHRTGGAVTAISRTAIRCIAGGVTAVLVVRELAGKITYLNARVDAAVDVCKNLGDLIAEAAPSYAVQAFSAIGLLVAVYLLRRRNQLYRKLVEEHGKITLKYELLVHPLRTSSGIAPDGQTAQRDEA